MAEVDPSTARKRRKEILTTHRIAKRTKPNEHDHPTSITDHSDNDHEVEDPSSKQSKSKTKYQNRYEPEVPMTKEEAAEWRREARRKRNRESAAASRNKVRNRITELEDEVKDWGSKYHGLMTRIQRLEETLQEATPSNNFVPSQSLNQSLVSPHISPQGLRTLNQDSALPLFPLLNNSQRQVMNGSSTLQGSNNQEHHVIEMTS